VAHRPWNWVRGQFKRGNQRSNNFNNKKAASDKGGKYIVFM
jgi:hypothetical protein